MKILNFSTFQRNIILLIVTIFAIFAISAGTITSIFSMDYNIDEIESSGVPIIMTVLDEPQQIQPTVIRKGNQNSKLPTRKENILRVDESWKIPDKISTTPNKNKERPAGKFEIGKDDLGDAPRFTDERSQLTNSDNQGIENPQLQAKEEDAPELKKTEKKEEPKQEKKTEQKKAAVVSNVINGQATYLPKPVYPASAKLVKAEGDVNVQVIVDETGKVIFANAVSGHSLLRQAAVDAARLSRYKPTILNGKSVKFSGIIVYEFRLL